MSRKILRPFWRYYGGKWRAAKSGAYPQPLYDTIIEPFAGAAGYSLVYGADRPVILVEKYPTIAAIWRWLIGADPQEIRAIPEVDSVDDLPEWVPQAARWLIGFTMNSAASTPRKTLSAGRRMLRAKHRQFEGWTAAMRERVAEQVPFIRTWRVRRCSIRSSRRCGGGQRRRRREGIESHDDFFWQIVSANQRELISATHQECA